MEIKNNNAIKLLDIIPKEQYENLNYILKNGFIKNNETKIEIWKNESSYWINIFKGKIIKGNGFYKKTENYGIDITDLKKSKYNRTKKYSLLFIKTILNDLKCEVNVDNCFSFITKPILKSIIQGKIKTNKEVKIAYYKALKFTMDINVYLHLSNNRSALDLYSIDNYYYNVTTNFNFENLDFNILTVFNVRLNYKWSLVRKQAETKKLSYLLEANRKLNKQEETVNLDNIF